MIVVADLQLHSRFSRAVSHQMTIPFIAQWARKKGIGLIATGDWTHPLWIREIQTNLTELGNGVLALKGQEEDSTAPRFLLATEISSIYSQGGKLRRVHTLIWVPTIASALKIIEAMRRRGCNLSADGRPIVGLSCINLAELVLSIEPTALLVPAHAWTPHFAVYGSASGFNSLEEAFGPFAKNIYAIETGLSSNPSMNWRITELDNRSIVSFSDAHSGPKLGREATVFELSELSYDAIRNALIPPGTRHPASPAGGQALGTISYTIEFYPEEGKYHYTGHRNCGISWGPEETKSKGTTCPVCHKPLTQGVLQRVEELAGRSEESLQLSVISYPLSDARPSGSQSTGQLKTDKPKSENRQQKTDNRIQVRFIKSSAFPHRPPFAMLVPLAEIIAEAVESMPTSQKVQSIYDTLVTDLGGEFSVLLQQPLSAISRLAGEKVADGVDRVRRGDITIDPGYDGVFGKVKIWSKEAEKKEEEDKEQLSLF